MSQFFNKSNSYQRGKRYSNWKVHVQVLVTVGNLYDLDILGPSLRFLFHFKKIHFMHLWFCYCRYNYSKYNISKAKWRRNKKKRVTHNSCNVAVNLLDCFIISLIFEVLTLKGWILPLVRHPSAWFWAWTRNSCKYLVLVWDVIL